MSEEILAARNSEVLRADKGDRGDPRENPPTSGIVQRDSCIIPPTCVISTDRTIGIFCSQQKLGPVPIDAESSCCIAWAAIRQHAVLFLPKGLVLAEPNKSAPCFSLWSYTNTSPVAYSSPLKVKSIIYVTTQHFDVKVKLAQYTSSGHTRKVNAAFVLSRASVKECVAQRRELHIYDYYGSSEGEIARLVNRPHFTVQDVIKSFKERKIIANKPKQSSREIFSDRDERWLLRKVKSENGAAPECRGMATGDSRENPPTSGIVRHDSHLRKSWSVHKDFQFWKTLLISDECKGNLFSSCGKAYVRRKPITELQVKILSTVDDQLRYGILWPFPYWRRTLRSFGDLSTHQQYWTRRLCRVLPAVVNKSHDGHDTICAITRTTTSKNALAISWTPVVSGVSDILIGYIKCHGETSTPLIGRYVEFNVSSTASSLETTQPSIHEAAETKRLAIVRNDPGCVFKAYVLQACSITVVQLTTTPLLECAKMHYRAGPPLVRPRANSYWHRFHKWRFHIWGDVDPCRLDRYPQHSVTFSSSILAVAETLQKAPLTNCEQLGPDDTVDYPAVIAHRCGARGVHGGLQVAVQRCQSTTDIGCSREIQHHDGNTARRSDEAVEARVSVALYGRR
ncbi:hypothetical protein PR048_002557 [Dryococelus australis]|uniref:Uncharacterized protein n=1 Tax=Dryococelus australis TaxID=614101 RepID=A0ABQ9IKI2_9NEOP|nr:hypothetical protein PR048_002557 [Dryococelus australis]